MTGFFVFRVRPVHLILASVLLLALPAWAYNARQAAHEAALASFLTGRIVAVDPGHGGPDPGASAPSGLLEKDVVLDISLRLAELLAAAGAEVHLTREQDVDLSGMPDASYRERWRAAHRRRVEIVREAGAEIAVSIHANAVGSPRWYGAQVFHSRESHEASRLLAEHIQRELRHITKGTERLVSNHVEHYLLNNVDIPAVVVEVGFLSNPREAALLARPEYRRRLAWAIFVGIARYFAEREQPPVTP